MGDEGSSSKLDNLPKEDLIKLVKKYIILHKQLRSKNEELTNKLELSDNANQNNEKTNEQDNQNSENIQNKLDELTRSNQILTDENLTLKQNIQDLNSQIDNLNSTMNEYKTFKFDMEPQLENARREIELNKSMLEMLNNEIKMLNSEKIQLEKRLFNIRRSKTPSVIVEEDEEDLEEEKRGITFNNDNNHLQTIDEEESNYNNHGETDSTIDHFNKLEHDNAVDFIQKNKNLTKDGILMLNKQIEDMTFYIDELKSELEAEKEKNNEYLNEIEKLKENCNENNNNNNETINKLNDLNDEIILNFKKEFFDQNDESINRENLVHLIKQKFNQQDEKCKYIENQLEKVINEFKTEIGSLETQLDNLKQKLKQTESDLEQEQNQLKQTQNKLEKYEKESNKSKFIDLELANYEKSIKNLNIQMIGKDKEISDLKSELNNEKENYSKLKIDLEKLEQERDDEKEKSTKLKQLLVKAKKDVSDAKAHESEHLNQDAKQRAQIESLNFELDNYKIQIADLVAERQKLLDKISNTNDSYFRSNQFLEAKLKSYENDLEESTQKLNELQTEYDNYKIKVQHAFKKQKELNESNTLNTNSNESQKYLIEIEQLKMVIIKLNEKLDDNQDKIKLLEKENEITQEEYSRALERNTKLIAELREKENEWKSKNQELVKDNSLRSDEINEIIRNLKIENEAQSTQYKEKIKNLNTQHCQSIDLLQTQLEETRNEIERLNKKIEELNKIQSNNLMHNNNNQNNQIRQEFQLNVTNTPKNETNFIIGLTDKEKESNKSSTKSLEELLNEPTQKSLNDSNNFVNTDSKLLLNQIDQLKQDLNKSKVKLDHLNELLNESELNNNRLSEQINLLKEEIRRLERNQEREKSISNMEYLKNVVYKFLTFSTPHEKAQLMPVLTTMLKLSQDEQNAIMTYAKVCANSDGNASGGGWTTYLPKWSS